MARALLTNMQMSARIAAKVSDTVGINNFKKDQMANYSSDELTSFIEIFEGRGKALSDISGRYNDMVREALDDKRLATEQRLANATYYGMHRDVAMEMADTSKKTAATIRIEKLLR